MKYNVNSNSRFGNPMSGNYAEFEADGTLVLKGDATGYEDIGKEAINLQQTGTGISINSSENRVEFTNASNLSDYMYLNVQLNHSWDLTTIYPHLHTEQTSAVVPNWLFQYRWQIRGGQKTTAWTNLICRTEIFTWTTGTLNQQVVTTVGITPPVGAGISDILQFRILRDNANTSGAFTGVDGLNATASVISFDVHIKIDTPQGSRQIGAK